MTRKFSYFLILFILSFSVLPLGSNRPVPLNVIGILIGCLCLLTGIRFWQGDMPRLPKRPFIILSICVSVGLPLFLLYQAGLSLYLISGLEHHDWHSFQIQNIYAFLPSVTPWRSFEMLIYTGQIILFAWIVSWSSLQKGFKQTVFKTIFYTALAITAYGLVDRLLGLDSILFWEKWAYQDFLTGSFVNRNSYATYAGMGMICGWFCIKNEIRQTNTAHSFDSRLSFQIGFFFQRIGFYVLGMVLLLLGLLLSGSRAGLSLSVSCALICGFFLWKRLSISSFLLSSCLIIFCLGIFFYISGHVVSDRFDHLTLSWYERLEVYKASMAAILDHPFGTGAGSFADVFPAYRHEMMNPEYLWDKAHNTYLQMILEWGIAPFLVMTLFFIYAVYIYLKFLYVGYKTGRTEVLVSLSGILLAVFHSAIDFSLQIPAIMLTWIALFSVGMAGCLSRLCLKK